MRRFSLLLGVVAVIALVAVGSVFAADTGGGKSKGGRGGTFGEITKIDGKSVTIKSGREGAPDVTATVGEDTEISQQIPAKMGDLKVGDRVSITQGEKRFYGEITKIDGKTITLKGRGGEDQTVTVDDSTKISAFAKAKIEDLKVGQQVMASVTEGKFTRISIRAPENK